MRAPASQLPLFPPDDPFADAVRPGQRPGFSVRESARAKRLSIKVFPRGKVEVVVPKRTRARDVAEFVQENSAWIRSAQEAFAAEHVPEPFALPRRIDLCALRESFAVEYRPQPGAVGVRCREAGKHLVVSGRTHDEKQCVEAIRRWLSRYAKRVLRPQLDALSVLTEMPYQRLQVRAQRTCWGSRSSSGTLSLNVCLLFLRPELLRYLMIHELCHGRHMNHSSRFWRLVGRFEADYKRLDRALTDSWKDVPSWLGIY